MFGVRPLCRSCFILTRKSFQINNRCSLLSVTNYSKKTGKKELDPEVVDDGPIKYSQSAARIYQAKTTRTGTTQSRLWYEPYVIMVSLAVFMVYFTLLREENDVDEDLGRSLYSRISGLEEHQLRLSLEFNREHGKDTADIVNRLKKIELEKTKNQEFQ